MRYAMIMAGGSGTRLWPMSTKGQPKQLIPFIQGRSLIQLAVDRLEGLVPVDQRCICAGEGHKQAILAGVEGVRPERFIGEPTGRDTVNAVGLVAAVLAERDPDATIAVFTADHLIRPVDRFQETVAHGYALAEARPETLVTFGIRPTDPATGYGYLQLGEPIEGEFGGARVVEQFKEKPDAETAQRYLDAGAERYLWNSGMFVWKAATLLECIRRFAPENHEGLSRIAKAWGTAKQREVIEAVYPALPKNSVDFAIMEPASGDDRVGVATVPMDVQWLDVGSWEAFAETLTPDDRRNAISAERTAMLDTENTVIASNDPDHLIATIGVENLVIVHTPHATLICDRDHAQRVKEMQQQVARDHGEGYV